MNNLKGLMRSRELNRRALKQISPIQLINKEQNKKEFNINLNPVHLDLSKKVNNKISVTGNSSLQGYLRKVNGLGLIPNLGLKEGILLNYQKFISYNFNNSDSLSSKFIGKIGIMTPLRGPIRGEVKYTYELLFYFFKSIYCLISKPVFLHSADKLIIQLFYYLNIPKNKVFKSFSKMYVSSFKKKWLQKNTQSLAIRKTNLKGKFNNFKTKFFITWRVRKAISRLRGKNTHIRNLLFNLRKFNISKIYHNKFLILCKLLSRKFNKAIELQLIRLHHPFHDTNILINLISLNIRNKNKNARIAINKIYEHNQIKIITDPTLKAVNMIPAFLSGINIKIAGRLMREPIIPRLTTKLFSKGASATGKVNYLDVATLTNKNRKGAYTITIKSGQNFFKSQEK